MDEKIKWISNSKSGTFDKVINTYADLKILPLTHKVKWKDALSIFKNDKILPIPCDFFDGNLIYFFYGIPDYKIAEKRRSRIDSTYLPICFLLKNECIEISNAFPFDSGAFKLNLYDNFIDTSDKSEIYNFSLDGNYNYIIRFLSTFYANNNDYYIGKPKANLQDLDYDENTDLYIGSYINLITRTGESEIDSRAHTIEIICENEVKLSENLVAIFAPKDICSFINHNPLYKGIDIVPYNTFYNEPPASYNSVIKDKVYNYLLVNNFL